MEKLFEMHLSLLASLPKNDFFRFQLDSIDWHEKSILLTGLRGVGKTILLHQYCTVKAGYKPVTDYLYILADSPFVAQKGLYNTVHEYFINYGGKAVFIDELQKFTGWQSEWKTILDIFREKQILVSGSSSLLLKETDADLKRRRAHYHMPPLSFREYLHLLYNIKLAPIPWHDIMQNSLEAAIAVGNAISQHPGLDNPSVIRLFREYLKQGQFPFIVDAKTSYLARMMETIIAVIEQDIGKLFSVEAESIDCLKKLISICAYSKPFTPNYVALGRELGMSKDTVKKFINYMEKSGLVNLIKTQPHKAIDIIHDKGKLFLSNTNYIHALNPNPDIGTIRETFFSQSTVDLHPCLHMKADFVIDDDVFEIGGPAKKGEQIAGLARSYLVKDDILTPSKGVIPLYLFGFRW